MLTRPFRLTRRSVSVSKIIIAILLSILCNDYIIFVMCRLMDDGLMISSAKNGSIQSWDLMAIIKSASDDTPNPSWSVQIDHQICWGSKTVGDKYQIFLITSDDDKMVNSNSILYNNQFRN